MKGPNKESWIVIYEAPGDIYYKKKEKEKVKERRRKRRRRIRRHENKITK